ncbi:MAG: type III secretion system inner membrane ring lipoprotein SctJ [Halochromatium sp.]|uniref:type III secretion system inner membrane ring lipoprotein SctJ n=1 Tax=Halochromatium sp. TaxID=2049430 RepID=UPI0039793AD9
MLIAILLLAACNDRVALYSDLSEQQANEVHAALRGEGIEAAKRDAEDGAWAIDVPADASPDAMAVLEARGLPRREFAAMDQLFSGEGFVSSPQEDRARYVYGLAQGLEKTLAGLDGVVQARVHLALPEEDELSDDEESGSASVVVVHEPGTELPQRETNIRAVVTDGVEAIRDPNQVTVEFFERAPFEPVADAESDDQPEVDTDTVIAGGSVLGGLVFLGIGLAGLLYWRRHGASAVAETRRQPGGTSQ